MSAPVGPTLGALLLDIDDTLVDTRAAFAEAVDAMARTWLPHLDARGRVGAVRHWVADRHGSFRAYTRGELTMDGQRRRRVDDLHVAFGGRPLDDDSWAAWLEGYLAAFSSAWRLRPQVPELLDHLDGAGVPFGAVTNASRALSEEKLRVLGLASRLSVLSAVDDRGVGKPDPRMFWSACEQLGVPPERTGYVGDEADVDAVAAVRAGLVGFWLDALLPREEADGVWERAGRWAGAEGVAQGRLHRVRELRELVSFLPGSVPSSALEQGRGGEVGGNGFGAGVGRPV